MRQTWRGDAVDMCGCPGPLPVTRRGVLAAGLSLLLGAASSAVGCRPGPRARSKKVVVLGIDGMDPRLLRRYVDGGRLPHFARLAREGGFRALGTSIPPQSPVAWSNLITGLDPGGHGIFDFVHRDPKTLSPYLSTSRVEPVKHTFRLGQWILPLVGGRVSLLRQGKAFWQVLDEHQVPATILKMPANFPPAESSSRTLAGMGTPDLLGTYGTFSFYTDRPPAGDVSGGRIYPVRVENGRVSAVLVGPYNSFRDGEPPATADFAVWLDPRESVVKIVVQGRDIVLRQGEWSDWVAVRFDLIPYLRSVTGICRFYLKQVRPAFELYVTPMNIDPSEPSLPLSTPKAYARELSERVGYFYTQGIAEDTKALSAGILSDDEYLAQARIVLAEQRTLFELELGRFRSGLLFAYFSSVDQNCHMFWRATDPRHPAYDPDVAARHSRLVDELYREMDAVLGEAIGTLDGDSTLLVLSDHGFAPYYRSFNLNTWLLEQGLAALRPGMPREAELLTGVDWGRTRAYALGLNALYLNLQGREGQGIVRPGAEARALLDRIASELLAIRDPATGHPVITRVDRAADAYAGPHVPDAPDLVVGYNWGYRASWATVLGGFPASVLEDNTGRWSGDHAMDFTLVPGILLSNRKIVADAPTLTDIAPTILAEFGVARPRGWVGQPVLGGGPPAAG